MNQTVDMVNHPPHYNSHPSGIECIEITQHLIGNLANAWKYIWRVGHKWDNTEDQKKTVFYLNQEMARIKKGHRDLTVGDFTACYHLMDAAIKHEPIIWKKKAFRAIFMYCVGMNPNYLKDCVDVLDEVLEEAA